MPQVLYSDSHINISGSVKTNYLICMQPNVFLRMTSIVRNNRNKCIHFICWVQFSSVAQSRPTLCDPIDCSMLGFPVHFYHCKAKVFCFFFSKFFELYWYNFLRYKPYLFVKKILWTLKECLDYVAINQNRFPKILLKCLWNWLCSSD